MRTRCQTRADERRALWRAAATLGLKPRRGKGGRTLPAVFFVTDPDRTPDPVRVAEALPRGTGVIFRGFGRPDATNIAQKLARTAKRRGLVLLIGADAGLAAKVGAHGVHLPERKLPEARGVRLRHPRWLVTGAVHSPKAVAAAQRLGLDAVVLSTAFPSASPSAGKPLGPIRLAAMVGRAKLPVIALGGVNERTAKRLIGTGVSGFAAVEGLA